MAIELLGAEWDPDFPPSFAQRQEIILSFRPGVESWRQVRVWGAALGATWAHPTIHLKSTMAKCGHDPQVYGEEVYNELSALGAEPADIVTQGLEAYTAIAASIPTPEAVTKRAGFSGPAGDRKPTAGSNALDET